MAAVPVIARTLRLPPDLDRKVVELSEQNGQSINAAYQMLIEEALKARTK